MDYKLVRGTKVQTADQICNEYNSLVGKIGSVETALDNLDDSTEEKYAISVLEDRLKVLKIELDKYAGKQFGEVEDASKIF